MGVQHNQLRHLIWQRARLFMAQIVLVLGICSVYGTAWGVGGQILSPFPQFAGNDKRQESLAMAVDSAGNIIVVGYQNLTGNTNDDFYTVKFKADGSGLAWTPQVLDYAGATDQATAVTIDSANDILVTGFVTTGGKRDILTVKYSGTTGDEIWRAVYNGSADGHEIPVAIKVDDRDNVYVAGYTQNSAANDDYLVIKYAKSGANLDGSPIWEVQYDGPGHGADRITGLAVGAGSVAVTGHSWNGADAVNGTDFDIATLKYSDTGALVWLKRTSSPGKQPDWGKAIAINGTGNVIMTGYLTTQIGQDIQKDVYTANYRNPSSGTTPDIAWEATYSTAFDDEPTAVAVVGSSVFVAGNTMTLTGNRDILVVQYRDPSSGSIPVSDWSSPRVINSGTGDIDEAVAMTADHAGNLYVTGTRSSTLANSQTIKLRQSDGLILWHHSYENPASKNNRPVGIGVSAGDDVYVAGSIDGTSAFDINYFAFRHDPGLINPPTSLTATGLTKQVNGTYSVTLNWLDNAANEDNFIVERKTGAGSFQPLITLGANSTTHTDTNLTEWTHYTYRVKARNTAVGDSHYSNEVQVFALIVAPMDPAWTYIHNGLFDADDFATAIAVGPDNNPVITGYTMDFAPGYTEGTHSNDFLTIKLDRANAGVTAGAGLGVLWKEQFEGGFNQEDDAKGVAVDGTNRVIVTGNSMQDVGGGDNVNSIVTMKFPAGGPPVLWQAQYNGPAMIDDRVRAVAASADGTDSVVVIGHGTATPPTDAQGNPLYPPHEDIYVIKYAANPPVDEFGKAQYEWAAQPVDGSHGNDYPAAVAYDKDSNVFVAGYIETAVDSMQFRTYIAKYCGKANSSACEGKQPGQQIWSHVLNYTDIPRGFEFDSDNQVRGLTIDGDGNVYTAGFIKKTGYGRDFLVTKFDGKGTPTGQRVIWSKSYRSAVYDQGDDEAVAIKYDPIDHRVVVAGNSDVANGDSDITIISYGATDGEVRWIKSVPSTGYDEVANDMVLDLSGNIYVVGSSTGGPQLNTDSLTVKFDYDGNMLGRTVYNQNGNIHDATAVAVNALGEVFVAGYGTNTSTGINGPNADYLVYKVAGVALQAPNPFTVTQNYRSAILSWSDNTSVESGYELERKSGACPSDVRTDDVTYPWAPVLGSPFAPNISGYTDTGLSSGGEYCYRLRAFTNVGEVTRWVPRGTTMLEPPAPTTFTATPTTTTAIQLGWGDATTNEEGFLIERCEGAACTFEPTDPGYLPITAPANSTSITDTAVCAGKVYRYRIQAFRTNTWRTAFTDLIGQVSPLPVTAPTAVTASALNEAQVRVNWTSQTPDADGYKIWRCADAGAVPCTDFGTTPAVSVGAGIASFADNTFASDTTVRYKISAFKQTASCTWDSAQSVASAGAKTATTALSLSASVITTTQAALSWTNPTATETGFRLERCVVPACTLPTDFTELVTTYPNTTTYTDSTICSGFTYGYRVQALNEGLTLNGKGTWAWRLPLTVANFSADKLVRLVLNYQTGMKTDYADIRFYDELGKVELPYWIETFTGQPTSVVVWIKLGANKDVSLYYGNAAAVSASNAAAVFGAAPVGYWPFREVAGTLTGTTVDISGNGLNATLSGMIASYGIVAGGKYGNALSMAPNGIVYVNDTANSPLDITGSITVELWYQYQKSMDWARIVSKRANGGSEPWDLYHIYLDADPLKQRAYFRVVSNNGMPYQGLQSPASPQLEPGTWYHLVGRYNATTGKISLFVNGVEYATTGTPISIGTNDEAFGIGTMGNSGNHALGILDEVRLYNKALSDQDVAARYAATLPTVTAVQSPVNGPFAFGGWSGSFSTPQPVLQVVPLVLPTPTGVTASWVSESQLKVDWAYTNGEQTGFEVYRCLGADCSLKVKDAGALERSFTDSGLTFNTTYSYQVRAVKAATCQAVSAFAVTLPVEATLKKPQMTPNPPVTIDTNCADLRLYDGAAQVPFWVERCNSAKTTLWTKYSTLPSGPKSLLLYYGSPASPSVGADPKTIFTFFDGFDGTAIDTTVWNITDATGWSVANGQLRGTNTTGRLDSKGSFGVGYLQEVKARTTTRAPNGQMMAGFNEPAYSYAAGWLDHPGTLHYRNYATWVAAGSELPLNTDLLYQVSNRGTTTIALSIYNFDTLTPVVDTGAQATQYGVAKIIALGRRYDSTSYNGQAYVADWDWLRVRRYLDVSVAPTATIGGEEVGPFAGMPGWLARRPVTISNPGVPLNYTSPDGYQIGIVVDSTPLATDQVTLTWQDTTATEEQFLVERCLGTVATCIPGQFAVDRTFTVPLASGVGSTVTYLDRELAKNTAYCYRVRATRSTGWLATPDSDIVCGQTAPQPNPPVLAASGNASSVSLTWTAAGTTGENGFEVDRCSIVFPATDCDLDAVHDAGFPKKLGPNLTTYLDDGVCGTYKYRVRSFKVGAAAWPGWSNAVTVPTNQPTAPSGVTVTPVSDIEATVSWTDNTSDEGGFEVWRCAGANCDFSTYAVIYAGAGTGTAASATDKVGLFPGTYRYQVRAIKQGSTCGWPSQFSAPSGNVVISAAAPTAVTALAGSTTQATVKWTESVLSENGFAIQRCKDTSLDTAVAACTDFAQAATVLGSNATSFSDTAICAGSKYRYKVGATNSGIQFTQPGSGCWSSRMQLQIGGFQPNFISRITVPRNADMKADYSDLRLYDSVAATEIPFWIEQYDGSGVTLVFKPGANNAIYLYFGNPSATGVSSATGVYGASLKAYWPFNENSGTISGILTDFSGNNNSVTMSGFAAPNGIVAGKYGNALSLDGVNDIATRPSPTVPTGSVMSVEAWVYPRGYGFDYNAFVSWGNRSCNGGGFGASVGTNGMPQLPTWCNDYFSAGPALTLNAWNHLVYVLNGQSAAVYVNGVKSNGSLTYLPNLASVNLAIGSLNPSAGTRHFNGMVDDLRIYNSALTSADVAARYSTTPPAITFGAIEKGAGCQNVYAGTLSAPATAITPALGNLLKDSDFESADYISSPWGQSAFGSYNTAFDKTTFYSGESSMKATAYASSNIGWTQAVTVVPNATYVLSVYMKTNLTTSGTRAQCDVQGTGIDTSGILTSTLGPVDWTYRQENVTIPSGTTSVNVRCFISGSNTGGDAWFDMVQFVPQQVITLTASRISEGTVRLDWSDVLQDESGFRVQRCTWPDASTSCNSFSQVGSDLPAGQTNFIDFSVTPDQKYSYRVEAFKTATCGWTQNSNVVPGITINLPTVTKPTVSVVDTTTLKVSWSSDTATETGFNLFRSSSVDGGVNWTAYGLLADKPGAGATSYNDTSACAGTLYRYKVQAFKNGLSSGGGACWTRSKTLLVSNHQQGYQLKLSIPRDDDMKADYGDVRFYDATTQVELPYWIENSAVTPATFWVKLGGSANVVMYYGNSSATAISDPNRVFEFFETFDGAAINTSRWQEVDTAANYVTQSDELLVSRNTTGSNVGVYSIASFARPLTFEVEGTAGVQYGDAHMGLKDTSTSALNYLHAAKVAWYEPPYFAIIDPGDPTAAAAYGGTITPGVKYSYRVDAKPVGAKYSFGPTGGSLTTVVNGTMGSVSPLKVALTTYIREMRFDNVRVRKYAEVEPTVVFGTETLLGSCPTFGGQWTSAESPVSDPVLAPLPVRPTLVSVTSINDTEMKVTWTPMTTDETGFSIERCQATGGNQTCTPANAGLSVAARSISFVDGSRLPSTYYCYRVIAVKNGVCQSNWGGLASDTGCDLTMAMVASDLQVIPLSSRALRLSWRDNASGNDEEDGYEIETLVSRAITPNNPNDQGTWTMIGKVGRNVTTYDHLQGLEPNRSYWYRVRPYRGEDKSPYTAPAVGTTLRINESPANSCP